MAAAAVIWLLLALAIALIAGALVLRRRSGIPWRRVVYSDTGAWQRAEQPLISRRYGLVGKPDYLVARGRQRIPVEVKPGRMAREPYPSDVMQLAAYCLLVEETYGAAPKYGLLRYARATFRVTWNARLRNELIALLGEMQASDPVRSAGRSHDEPGRCAACGFRDLCDEALA
jgi:CRISPR-associated exonuclease Cas4